MTDDIKVNNGSRPDAAFPFHIGRVGFRDNGEEIAYRARKVPVDLPVDGLIDGIRYRATKAWESDITSGTVVVRVEKLD